MAEENLYTPNCLRTFTGRYINLLEPEPEHIFPFDIAIGLARTCRFAGQTKKFYSVAEHSDWCRHEMELLERGNTNIVFATLLHDAHEFILCDIATPLKKLMPQYDIVAQKLQNAIHRRFNVRLTHNEESLIRKIDKKALEWEWDNKVIKWTGLKLDEKDRADLWLHHFVRLCPTPFILK